MPTSDVISSAHAIAPGSNLSMRHGDWVVTATEMTADGLLLRLQVLSELVRDTSAALFESLGTIEPMDSPAARVIGGGWSVVGSTLDDVLTGLGPKE